MAGGSIRGSIFTFLSVGLGTGILSFPGLMAKNGFVMCLILILIGCLSAVWSLNMIVTGLDTSKARNFQDLAKKGGGKKMRRLLEIAMITLVIGGCISYQIIMVQLSQFLIVNSSSMTREQVYSWQMRALIGAPTAILFVFPLSMMKNMHDFRYLSLFAFGCVFYTVSVAILELPGYILKNFRPDRVVYFSFGLHKLQALSVGIFSFTI